MNATSVGVHVSAVAPAAAATSFRHEPGAPDTVPKLNAGGPPHHALLGCGRGTACSLRDAPPVRAAAPAPAPPSGSSLAGACARDAPPVLVASSALAPPSDSPLAGARARPPKKGSSSAACALVTSTTSTSAGQIDAAQDRSGGARRRPQRSARAPAAPIAALPGAKWAPRARGKARVPPPSTARQLKRATEPWLLFNSQTGARAQAQRSAAQARLALRLAARCAAAAPEGAGGDGGRTAAPRGPSRGGRGPRPTCTLQCVSQRWPYAKCARMCGNVPPARRPHGALAPRRAAWLQQPRAAAMQHGVRACLSARLTGVQ